LFLQLPLAAFADRREVQGSLEVLFDRRRSHLHRRRRQRAGVLYDGFFGNQKRAGLEEETDGVTRDGSSTDFALRYLVQKNGIKFLPGCPWQKDTPSRS